MVKGLERFRETFQDYTDSFVLIGGTACDLLMGSFSIPFRATKDLDIVLILESIRPAFTDTLKQFLKAGGYATLERADGTNTFYRFGKPTHPEYPVLIELFSRKPIDLALFPDQHIVPVVTDEAVQSLSAILIDNAYYDLIRNCIRYIEGVPTLSAQGLIPLKTKAWLDLERRQETGEQIDSHSVKKHLYDVFRLCLTLTEADTFTLTSPIGTDMREFIRKVRENPPDLGPVLKEYGLRSPSSEPYLRLLERLMDNEIVSFKT